MKRLRRFLEIIAACGLATVAAYWLAMSDAGPGAELVTHTKASTSPAETALQTSPNREANSYSRPSNVEQLPSYEPGPQVYIQNKVQSEDKPNKAVAGTVVNPFICNSPSTATAFPDRLVTTGYDLPARSEPDSVMVSPQETESRTIVPVNYEVDPSSPVADVGSPVRLRVTSLEESPDRGRVAPITYQEANPSAVSERGLSNVDDPTLQVPPGGNSEALSGLQSDAQGRSGPSQERSTQEVVPSPLPDIREMTINPPQAEITVNQAGIQLELRDADIRDAVHTLAKLAKLNVVMSSSVQGKVTVSLNTLTPRDAIFAVLRVPGFVSQEHEGVLYIGTEQEIQNLGYITDQIATRIYRPNYTPAKELESLIKPLLTPQVGLITVSTAAENGIAPDPSNAGGDRYAGTDVLIVRDYQRVLKEVDRVVQEVDVRPAQVAIEAMILSVNLDDKDQFGVSFELLRNKGYIKLGWGLVPQSLSDIKFDNNGLKLAFLDGSIGAFLNALESIGDTNVIATPRLLVLNKHRAEILIGKELGYVSTTFTETSSSQTVDFLKVGAQLVIRPFISNDGLIRMEVHPELSTGSVQITNNFTVPNKDTTQVTTNIMVPNGVTVVIGGLMREDLEKTASQIPFFGNLPLIGAAFRNKMETTRKQEIIVLITPYIIDDYRMATDGATAQASWQRRQEVAGEEMSGLNKQNASKHFLEKAKTAYLQGRCDAAKYWAEMAVHFDPSNLEAIAFRDQLAGVATQNTSATLRPSNR